MSWRLAKSLETLRKQVNTKYPNRSHESDGTIGDEHHSARTSDHNPNDAGVVCAFDITHDPADGFDSYTFADMLLRKQDPRLKYVISNRRIGAGPGGPQPGVWRSYNGINPHNHHCHVSVRADATHYDNEATWQLDDLPVAPTVPVTPAKAIVKPHTTLRLGSRGPKVAELQKKLGLVADGVYGIKTMKAIRYIQNLRRIVADGVCGPQTWAIINE